MSSVGWALLRQLRLRPTGSAGMHAPEHQQRDGVDHHGRSNLYAAIKVPIHTGRATMSTMPAQCATISTLRPVRLSVLMDFSQTLAQRPAIPWPDNVGLYCSPLPTPSF